MCRMLGVLGVPPLPVQEAMQAFYPLCTQGCVKKGMEPGHGDGWGVSGFHDKRAVYFQRQAAPAATQKSEFEQASERALKSQTPVLFAHFRKSSGSPVGIANTHPFHFRDWIFVHNGTIHGAVASFPLNETEPQGDTDSERFFLYLWEKIHATADPTATLTMILKKTRDQLIYSSLNFLLSDGAHLWAYRDFGDKRLEKGETVADREKYYTLFWTTVGRNAIVCSEPLAGLSKKWKPLAQRTLAVFSPGTAAPQLITI